MIDESDVTPPGCGASHDKLTTASRGLGAMVVAAPPVSVMSDALNAKSHDGVRSERGVWVDPLAELAKQAPHR